MKVCVPSAGPGGLDDRVGEHFGRVPTFTVFDTETETAEVLANTSEHMGGSGMPGEHLIQAGVDVVLCSGMGGRALAMLDEHGVEVCTGASGTVREAIEAWKGDRLGRGDACNRHLFHDHGH